MSEEQPPESGAIKPGSTPPYPFPADNNPNADAIAEAAWAQSNGSIQAFTQLCQEHANGEINLLPGSEGGGEAAPANIDVPAVTGNPAVGSTLSCTMGNWSGEPTGYAYGWTSDGAPVGTDSADYLVDAGDAGKSLCCIVTASNAAGSTAAPPSNSVAIPA